jgi:hypothetical protein
MDLFFFFLKEIFIIYNTKIAVIGSAFGPLFEHLLCSGRKSSRPSHWRGKYGIQFEAEV